MTCRSFGVRTTGHMHGGWRCGLCQRQNDRHQGICQAMKRLQTEQLVGDIVSEESVTNRPGGTAWGQFWVWLGWSCIVSVLGKCQEISSA